MTKIEIRENRLFSYFVKQDIKNIKNVLNQDLDWNYFFSQIKREGVSSLVYKTLFESNIDKSIMPDDVWNGLRACYYTVAARNTLLYERLKEILHSLNQANIEVIILKGMALGQTVYNDIGLRPAYDIDILIHKNDFCLVEEILRRLGYINSSSYPEDFHKDNIMVDVHWELINVTRVQSRSKCHRLDIEEIWQNSRYIGLSGQKVRVLLSEHCLMELCLHLVFHHGLNGLMWFIDIAKVIDKYQNEIDWDKFIRDCLRFKINKPVYYTLFYVKEILNQSVPQFVLDQLKPTRQNALEIKIFNLILSGSHIENARFLFTLLAMEGIVDKMVFIKEIFLPSARIVSSRYNGRGLALGYLLHLKEVATSGVKIMQRLLPV